VYSLLPADYYDQVASLFSFLFYFTITPSKTWQIRVLDGSNGKVVMNLPARLRRWDVHGESLAVEGTAADVILDWIGDDEDETAQIQINRLMGVINTRRIFFISILQITIRLLT
jgi:hypothetical protein